MAYTVSLRPAAERAWRKLPSEIRPRINRALLALENDPRPHGVSQLRGYANRWRIRVGDYRVIYRINDATNNVEILRIAHRRDVYR